MATYLPLAGGSGAAAGAGVGGGSAAASSPKEGGDSSASGSGAAPQATAMVFLVDLQVSRFREGCSPLSGRTSGPCSATCVLIVSRRARNLANSAVFVGESAMVRNLSKRTPGIERVPTG